MSPIHWILCAFVGGGLHGRLFRIPPLSKVWFHLEPAPEKGTMFAVYMRQTYYVYPTRFWGAHIAVLDGHDPMESSVWFFRRDDTEYSCLVADGPSADMIPIVEQIAALGWEELMTSGNNAG